MIFSDLQGHLSIGSLFKCDLSYSCAAVSKISTDVTRHASTIAELLVYKCVCLGICNSLLFWNDREPAVRLLLARLHIV